MGVRRTAPVAGLLVGLMVLGGAAPGLAAEQTTATSSPAAVDSTTAFVQAAYVDFLFRGATDAEIAAAVARLNAGTSTKTFLTELSRSPEWTSSVIRQLYVNTLGREPDATGLAQWQSRLRSGQMTLTQIAAHFYSSQEYFTKFGGGTNQGWITDLYKKLLGRDPDAGGLQHWIVETQKVGRGPVALSFYQSLESRRFRVNALYQKLLGRDADPTGLNSWSQAILTVDDLNLAVSLAQSVEYRNRAVSRAAAYQVALPAGASLGVVVSGAGSLSQYTQGGWVSRGGGNLTALDVVDSGLTTHFVGIGANSIVYDRTEAVGWRSLGSQTCTGLGAGLYGSAVRVGCTTSGNRLITADFAASSNPTSLSFGAASTGATITGSAAVNTTSTPITPGNVQPVEYLARGTGGGVLSNTAAGFATATGVSALAGCTGDPSLDTRGRTLVAACTVSTQGRVFVRSATSTQTVTLDKPARDVAVAATAEGVYVVIAGTDGQVWSRWLPVDGAQGTDWLSLGQVDASKIALSLGPDALATGGTATSIGSGTLAAVSSDGLWSATAESGSVILTNLTTKVRRQVGAGTATEVAISSTGQYVAYVMGANTYIWDRTSGSTAIAGAAGTHLRMSGDGNQLVLLRGGSIRLLTPAEGDNELGQGGDPSVNALTNTVVWANSSGGLTFWNGPDGSTSTYASPKAGWVVRQPSISADASKVAFQVQDNATNPTVSEIWYLDRVAGTSTQLTSEGMISADPSLSENGSVIGFTSTAPDLAGTDRNKGADSFLVNPTSKAVTRLTGVATATTPHVVVDADGNRVLYVSTGAQPGGTTAGSYLYSR